MNRCLMYLIFSATLFLTRSLFASDEGRRIDIPDLLDQEILNQECSLPNYDDPQVLARELAPRVLKDGEKNSCFSALEKCLMQLANKDKQSYQDVVKHTQQALHHNKPTKLLGPVFNDPLQAVLLELMAKVWQEADQEKQELKKNNASLENLNKQTMAHFKTLEKKELRNQRAKIMGVELTPFKKKLILTALITCAAAGSSAFTQWYFECCRCS